MQPCFMGCLMITEKTEMECLSGDEPQGIKKSLRNISVLLLLLFMAVSPFLNRMTIVPTGKVEQMLTNMPQFFDLFAFFKSQSAVAMSLFFGVLLLALLLTKAVKQVDWRITGALMGFLFLAVVSAVNSPVQIIALTGLFDRYEGLGVWIYYILGALLGMCTMRGPREWRLLKQVLMFILGVQILVGFSQFFNHNLLDFPWVRNLMISPTLAAENEIGLLSGGGSVYGTLNNPNFYSQGIALLMVPILSDLAHGSKSWLSRVLFALGGIALAMTACSGGIIGFLAAVLVVSIMTPMAQEDSKLLGGLLATPFLFAVGTLVLAYKSPSMADIGLLLGLPLALLLGISLRKYFDGAKKAIGLRLGFVLIFLGFAGFIVWAAIPAPSVQTVQRIVIDAEKMQIDFPEGRVNLSATKSGAVTVMGSQGKLLVNELTEGIVELKALNETLEVKPQNGFTGVRFTRLNAVFLVVEGNFYIQDPRYQPANNLNSPTMFGFQGKERFGSGRGFIWSRSIPLLRNTLLLGVGPDVFPYVFPQADYAGKINMGAPTILVDKPHNWFLQVAIGTGVISLLCLIYVGTRVVRQSLALNRTSEKKEYLCMAVTVVAFITAFAVTGLFYDSIISVSIWVWPVMGSLIGLIGGADQSDKI